MALLDYKIVRFSHEGRHVSADVCVYRGSIQNVTEPDWESFEIPRPSRTVSRYVRIAKVRDFHLEYDVPRDMTRAEFLAKVRGFLNNKLVTYAQANGHTVITEQQDISDYEPVNNEIET